MNYTGSKTRYDNFHEDWLTMRLAGYSYREISRKYKCKDSMIACRVRWLADKKGIILINDYARERKTYQNKEEYYFDNVAKKEGCWGWKGWKYSTGYGSFTFKKERYLIHVLSFLIHKGSTNGLLVCHTCDNPICSNPDHLFLGTTSDNSIDMRNKGRSPFQKLSLKTAAEVKYLLQEGKTTITGIGLLYGVNRRTIRRIRDGEGWVGVNPVAPILKNFRQFPTV